MHVAALRHFGLFCGTVNANTVLRQYRAAPTPCCANTVLRPRGPLPTNDPERRRAMSILDAPRLALTFDDILLQPGLSEVHPAEVGLPPMVV